ncbi:MAG: PH domain-containing protein [Campylobacteraceae bacterium]|jgi:uncharacterized membrane protein YdbT with pleckstrin-like domain|nr:PH domain-containing protein [Campylobacteraceae bacterium]
MSYIKETLISGEEVIYEGRLSVWFLLPRILLGILFLLFSVGFVWLILVALLIFGWAYITYISTELAFTNKRVIAKIGFIKRVTVELNISKVESIQVHQSVLGRIFNYGSIVIAGAGNPQAPIAGISKPMIFRNKFMEYTSK